LKKSYRNVLFGILWACVSVSSLYAEPGFGVHVGPLLSGQWSPRDDDTGADVKKRWLTRFSAGIHAEFDLSAWLSFRPGFSYVQKGARHDISIPDFQFSAIHALYEYDYFELPLLLKASPFRWNRIRPFSTGGLYLSRLGRTSYKADIEKLGTIESEMESMGKWDWGFTFGYGLDVRFLPWLMSLEYRYSMGFVDMKLPTGPGFPEIRLRNMVHAFNVGIGLR